MGGRQQTTKGLRPHWIATNLMCVLSLFEFVLAVLVIQKLRTMVRIASICSFESFELQEALP